MILEEHIDAAARKAKPDPHEIDRYEEINGEWYLKSAVDLARREYAETCGTPVVLDGEELGKINDEAMVPNPDVCGIGDVTSDEKGSGARFNDGKVPLELIPIEQLVDLFEFYDTDGRHDYIIMMLSRLSDWQKGDDGALGDIMEHLEWSDFAEAAFVWQYGAKKYAAWNWAKGMPWSVPVACILRHCEKIIVEREEIDPESGREHWGHVVCNLLMLDHFSRYYKEGDDRPPSVIFEES